jgi:hypothetical protein
MAGALKRIPEQRSTMTHIGGRDSVVRMNGEPLRWIHEDGIALERVAQCSAGNSNDSVAEAVKNVVFQPRIALQTVVASGNLAEQPIHHGRPWRAYGKFLPTRACLLSGQRLLAVNDSLQLPAGWLEIVWGRDRQVGELLDDGHDFGAPKIAYEECVRLGEMLIAWQPS